MRAINEEERQDLEKAKRATDACEVKRSQIDFFEDETDGGSDADVVAFAKKTLPKLRSHLEMAENINDNL